MTGRRWLAVLLLLGAVAASRPALAAPAANDEQPDRLIAERIWGDELLFSSAVQRLSEADQKFFARRIDVTARVIAANAALLPEEEREAYVDQSIGGPDGVVPTLRGEVENCAKYGIRPLRDLKPHVPGELYIPSWIDWPAMGFLAIAIIAICIFYLNRLRKRRA